MWVADGDEYRRQVALSLLSPTGLDVDVAEDGIAAVRAIGERDYALVLMDVRMPHMDGIEAIRLVRAMRDRLDLPVVATGANVDEAGRRRYIDAGMNDFIPPALVPRLLYSALLRWLHPCHKGETEVATQPASAG